MESRGDRRGQVREELSVNRGGSAHRNPSQEEERERERVRKSGEGEGREEERRLWQVYLAELLTYINTEFLIATLLRSGPASGLLMMKLEFRVIKMARLN